MLNGYLKDVIFEDHRYFIKGECSCLPQQASTRILFVSVFYQNPLKYLLQMDSTFSFNPLNHASNVSFFFNLIS